MLQLGGRPAFRMRLVLAATLSSVYGIYNGFELIENRPRGDAGTTEYYLDSEMYQHKVWDWGRPGNIVDDVTRINRVRRDNPALQLYDNLRFYASDNDQLLVYGKATPDRANIVVCVVNLDPFWPQAGWLDVPLQDWGIGPDQPYVMHDLLSDDRFTWRGSSNWVRLDPNVQARAHLSGRNPALLVVLIEELQRARWFGGKSRAIRDARVIDRARWVADSELCLVEVQYELGQPETYVLAERLDDPPGRAGAAEPVSRAQRADRRGRHAHVQRDPRARRHRC